VCGSVPAAVASETAAFDVEATLIIVAIANKLARIEPERSEPGTIFARPLARANQ
jgi:hypothetical protein